MSKLEWPGNQCDCSGENLRIHDYLCEILDQMGYSENDVCIASVGMWGAIKVMRDKLDVAKKDNEILEVFNANLQKEFDRVNQLVQVLDKRLREATTAPTPSSPQPVLKVPPRPESGTE